MPLLLAAASLVASAACRRGVPAAALPEHLRPFVFSTGWVSHEPLTEILIATSREQFSSFGDAATRETLARYLSTLEQLGPRTRPELFTTKEDVIAYLINAHIGWALALHDAGGLKPAGSYDPRTMPVPVDGGETTLGRIEDQLLVFAADEPRIVLCLNPGLKGGPPLPVAALEGYALTWQLADQAARCGRSPGFWQLEAGRRRVGLSASTSFMPGLPAEPAARLQRLLELVPPPPDLRLRLAATCGEDLKACSTYTIPLV